MEHIETGRSQHVTVRTWENTRIWTHDAQKSPWKLVEVQLVPSPTGCMLVSFGFSFMNLNTKNIPQIPLKGWMIFLKSWWTTSTGVISQAQPGSSVTTNQRLGSPRSLHTCSPFGDMFGDMGDEAVEFLTWQIKAEERSILTSVDFIVDRTQVAIYGRRCRCWPSVQSSLSWDFVGCHVARQCHALVFWQSAKQQMWDGRNKHRKGREHRLSSSIWHSLALSLAPIWLISCPFCEYPHHTHQS